MDTIIKYQVLVTSSFLIWIHLCFEDSNNEPRGDVISIYERKRNYKDSMSIKIMTSRWPNYFQYYFDSDVRIPETEVVEGRGVRKRKNRKIQRSIPTFEVRQSYTYSRSSLNTNDSRLLNAVLISVWPQIENRAPRVGDENVGSNKEYSYLDTGNGFSKLLIRFW